MIAASEQEAVRQHEEVFQSVDMDCSRGEAAIERVVKPVQGVLSVRVDLASLQVVISHDGYPTRAELTGALKQTSVTVRNFDWPRFARHICFAVGGIR